MKAAITHKDIMLRRLASSLPCVATSGSASLSTSATWRLAVDATEGLLRRNIPTSPQSVALPSSSSSNRGSIWKGPPGKPWVFRGFAAEAAAASTHEASTSSPATGAAGTITIDPSVERRMKQLQDAEAGSNLMLRIEVEGGGCSGFHYKFNLDTVVNDDDMVFEQGDARVVCDPSSFEFLKGSKVEFEESLLRSAFVVSTNPNAEMTCGCGTSFAMKF